MDALYNAIIDNDLKLVETYISKKPQFINVISRFDGIPCFARAKSPEMAKLIVKYGHPAEFRANFNRSILTECISEEIAEVYIKYGIDVNKYCPIKYFCCPDVKFNLIDRSNLDEIKIVKLLIKHGADVFFQGNLLYCKDIILSERKNHLMVVQEFIGLDITSVIEEYLLN